MNSNKIEKLSLLSELIKLARADKEVREMEVNFLMAIANQLEISEDEFVPLFNQYIDFTPPVDEFNRILQLQRLILMCNVDSESNKEEIEFIKEVGVKLGLNPLAVGEVLEKMNAYEDKVIPPEVLIQIFTRTYN